MTGKTIRIFLTDGLPARPAQQEGGGPAHRRLPARRTRPGRPVAGAGLHRRGRQRPQAAAAPQEERGQGLLGAHRRPATSLRSAGGLSKGVAVRCRVCPTPASRSSTRTGVVTVYTGRRPRYRERVRSPLQWCRSGRCYGEAHAQLRPHHHRPRHDGRSTLHPGSAHTVATVVDMVRRA